MSIRDRLQQEWAKKCLETRNGILDVAPRAGKCRVGVLVFRELEPTERIVIAYPDASIKQSWVDEFEETKYYNPNIQFTTFRSLEKWINEEGVLFVVDECHLLSDNNIASVKQIQAKNDVLAFTGTLGKETKKKLNLELGWPVIVKYTQQQAINDGIVTDYRITVVTVSLDNQTLIQYSKKKNTEKRQFDAYSYVITKTENEGKDSMFMKLGRRRIIQGSIGKLNKTKQLLEQFKNERVLVFCGLIKIADSLGIPTHHSKSDDNLEKFAKGEIPHLAVVRMGNAGITYKPLNKVIINSFDSNSENMQQRINRAMNMEYDNPEKIADIYILSSDEEVELRWLNRALQPFKQEKIRWL
jgi:superfamily II DNA or RNA helicase